MTVWLCSGQGAQRPGMGADLLACDEFEQVKDVFAIGSSVLGIDLAELACNGSEEQINDPFAAQALTVAISGVWKPPAVLRRATLRSPCSAAQAACARSIAAVLPLITTWPGQV